MNNNNKITKSVRKLMDDHETYTFQELVRALRKQGLDPSLEQVQEALNTMLIERCLWFDDALKIGTYSRDVNPDDYEMGYIVTRDDNVENVQAATGSPFCADFPPGLVIGMHADADAAHRVATTDWFDKPGIRTVWSREDGPDEDTWGDWKPLYFVLGQAEQVLPRMPVREPAEAKERPDAEYIAAEMAAIKDALEASISEPVYRRLRGDSGSVVKLSFSVTVDRGESTVDAKMSGTTKLENKASRGIKDPAQMELPLDDGGEVNAVVLANARWKQKNATELAEASERLGIKTRGSRTGTPFEELIVCQMNVRTDYGDVTPETVREFLQADEKEAQRVYLDMLEAAAWATGKGGQP